MYGKNLKKKLSLFNGRDTHNLIVSFIETYIKTRKYLPIQKENYEILTKY